MSIFGTIAAAVAPKLVEGALSIFGAKKDRKRARIAQNEQFQRLRDSAVRGGFNPLTALLATGGGGFQPGALQSSAPLASARAISGAVEGVADIVTGKAAERRARDKAEVELMQLEIENRKADRVRAAGGVSATSVPQLGRTAAKLAPMAAAREPFNGRPPVEEGEELVTNPLGRSSPQYVDPRSPDAETAEARYGDIAQEIGGALNVVRDFRYGAKLRRLAREVSEEAADRVHSIIAANPRADLDEEIAKERRKRGLKGDSDDQERQPALDQMFMKPRRRYFGGGNT